MIRYDRLWGTLKEKNISQYSLIKDYDIDKAQLQRLRDNAVVKTPPGTSLYPAVKPILLPSHLFFGMFQSRSHPSALFFQPSVV